MSVLDVIAQTRLLDTGAPYPILSGTENIPGGKYEITITTSNSDVWLGGRTMPAGNTFTLPVSSESTVFGYQLTADKEYVFRITVNDFTDFTLYATTTDTDGAIIAVLALPVL